MPEKKKTTTVGKMTERRTTDLEASKASKTAPSRSGAAAAARTVNSQDQLSHFEGAMKLFHARKFKEAREAFQLAIQGPERDVANRAQLHATMCERRLEQQGPVGLRTTEDYYNYGIALLNTRQIDEARTHLERALQLSPDADHVIYALAVAQALAGDADGAHDHLKRAIELEPRNRLMARQDGDFGALAAQPPFQALLYPEKKNW